MNTKEAPVIGIKEQERIFNPIIMKLRTFGLTEEEAEAKIIEGFLR